MKDALVQLGSGPDFDTRLANANLVLPTGTGSQPLWAPDNKDFAPRFGFSWDPLGKGDFVVRGGYGIFYEPGFDNLWQSIRANNVNVPFYQVVGTGSTNYLAPIASVLPSYANQSTLSNFPGVTLVDPHLRNGYSQSFFLGIQQSIGNNLTIDITGTGALGRRLVTTDIVNRQFSVDYTYDGRPNDNLPDVAWRSSQGISDYYALSSIVRWQLRSLMLQGEYTWSHSIDNQSDPLVADFFDLSFTAIDNSSGLEQRSAFARQFDSNGDRGNSDFDQRQNLFILGIWQSPGQRWWSKGWKASWMAAFRSGEPYTVFEASPFPEIGVGDFENPRADLLLNNVYLSKAVPVTGGVQVLNPAAFGNSVSLTNVGTLGRNSLTGPGLYNLDFSLARSFSLPKLPESWQFTVRADAFNFLNHANLNNPDNLITDANFGVETYGRQGSLLRASRGFAGERNRAADSDHAEAAVLKRSAFFYFQTRRLRHRIHLRSVVLVYARLERTSANRVFGTQAEWHLEPVSRRDRIEVENRLGCRHAEFFPDARSSGSRFARDRSRGLL